MIPDLAHRVSVFGLLKPVACRICFDVTLTKTIYVSVMSPSSEKTGTLPVPAEMAGGLNSRKSVDTRSVNGRYGEQICVTAALSPARSKTPVPREGQQPRTHPHW